MNLAGLSDALGQSARFYESQAPDRAFSFGQDAFRASELAAVARRLATLAAGDPGDFADAIRSSFSVYQSVGMDSTGTVVFSAYYEHELAGSLTKTKRFVYPIYGRPRDLVEKLAADGSRQAGRQTGGRWRPYYSRSEIDSGKALAGRGLEIAWAADPVEVFFLQVQGSGWLRLPDGRRLRLRYAGNNGLPYKSVGGNMIERGILSREEFSRVRMVAYLSSHPGERQALLNYNPRYVFFQFDRGPSQEAAFGSLNVPLTARRSVATDHRLFPPGALGWMETDTKNRTARFVLNQDEGGAIKGPARVDYFMGGDSHAETDAVQFWERGRLYFLAPRRAATDLGAP